MTEQRLYVVTQGGTDRLVRAPNPAVARSHVAKSTIAVKVATTMDTYTLALSGVKVEETSSAPAQREIGEPA